MFKIYCKHFNRRESSNPLQKFLQEERVQAADENKEGKYKTRLCGLLFIVKKKKKKFPLGSGDGPSVES